MITVNILGTEAILAAFEKLGAAGQQQALASVAVKIESYVEQEADKHTKTGALFQSVFSRKITGGYEIGHDLQRAPHALFVHWGTAPHEIKHRQRKTLRWPAENNFVFAKKVDHPGNAPDKWLERAADMAPRLFAEEIKKLLEGMKNGT
jgi:hypothetical protein